MNPAEFRVRSISAGYGGVGPASPAPYPDLWIVLFVAIEASEHLTGVALDRLELVDGAGNLVARATPPFSLRRDTTNDEARRRWDFGEQGTIPFDGVVEPGQVVRLRVHAPLDTRAESLRPLPARFRALFRASEGPAVSLDAPIGPPWVAAGPAAPVDDPDGTPHRR